MVRADGQEQLSHSWRIASRARWPGARLSGVMIQELVPGGVLAVNAWVDAERVEILLASDKTTSGEPFFATHEEVAPSRLAAAPELSDVIRRAVRAVGIEQAVVHAELVAGASGLVVLELTPRPGGGPVVHLVQAATGVSLITRAADLALGRTADATGEQRVAAFRILRASEAGRIARLSGGELPPGARLRLLADVGDRVRLPPESFVDVLGWVVASAEDRPGALRKLDEACRGIRLEVVAPHGLRGTWALARRVARPRYRQRLFDRLRTGA